MQDRLIRIEEKMAHLERFVGELDGVVQALHARLDGLGRRLEALEKSVAVQGDFESGPSAGDGGSERSDEAIRDERPPHW